MKKFKFKKLPLRVYLLYLVVASLIFTGVTFSSYVSTATGGDVVQVALFAADTSVNIPVTDMKPGDSFDITIQFQNYEVGENGEKRICEVSQTFSATAETMTKRIPLELEWLQDPQSDFHVNEAFKDGTIEKSFTLRVSWPVENGEYPDSSFADEMEVIRISVNAQQID